MPIIKAYTLPHPPLAIPAIGKGQEREIKKTIAAYNEVAADIAAIKPESIVYITPHNTIYTDYFHVSPGRMAYGDFGKFGSRDIFFEIKYDEWIVTMLERIAEQSDFPMGTQGERDAKLDHGVMVPMWYINRKYDDYKAVRISQSGLSPAEHYMLGQILDQAADACKRRVVVIASSDLSHRLKDDGPYGYTPEGPEFDSMVTKALAGGDFLSLMNIPDKIREGAGECGYNSLIAMAGLFDGKSVASKLLSYEGPFGVGYAAGMFYKTGWDDNRKFLVKYLDKMLKESEITRKAEDEYQNLARQSLEHVIKTGGTMPVPKGLPKEMLEKKAGVFVSIHKRGKLRGCIGTIAPTTNSIAEEIIRNAVSSGLSDTRFAPVTEDELRFLSYKVDVLNPPEKINGKDELDVKKYGVIVTSGRKRGLLLPNLDGVDTIEDQINIALSKGGISEDEDYELERFEVIRHGE